MFRVRELTDCDIVAAAGKWGILQDELTRAQHYRSLATQMRELARIETDKKRAGELRDLAGQYDKIADKLIPAAATKH